MVFCLGAAAGSFLNSCAWRIPRNKPFILARSACTECNHLLGVRDLIPIVSFLLLRGRCRYCRTKISLRYPLVELVSGLVCLAVVFIYGFSPSCVINLVLAGILLTATLIDLDWLYVPNELVLFGFICGIILSCKFGIPLRTLTLGFLAGILPMLTIYLASRGGMGAGDVKLSGMMGVFLGWKLTTIALFLSFLGGAAVGLILIVSGKKGRKDAVPFVPFLALGGIISLLWGQNIIYWYLALSGL